MLEGTCGCTEGQNREECNAAREAHHTPEVVYLLHCQETAVVLCDFVILLHLRWSYDQQGGHKNLLQDFAGAVLELKGPC